jgi:hypothetical protein
VVVLNVIGPIVRMYNPAAFNEASVPAKFIAKILAHNGNKDGAVTGKSFILGKDVVTSALSHDAAQQKIVWAHVLNDLGINEEELVL